MKMQILPRASTSHEPMPETCTLRGRAPSRTATSVVRSRSLLCKAGGIGASTCFASLLPSSRPFDANDLQDLRQMCPCTDRWFQSVHVPICRKCLDQVRTVVPEAARSAVGMQVSDILGCCLNCKEVYYTVPVNPYHHSSTERIYLSAQPKGEEVTKRDGQWMFLWPTRATRFPQADKHTARRAHELFSLTCFAACLNTSTTCHLKAMQKSNEKLDLTYRFAERCSDERLLCAMR